MSRAVHQCELQAVIPVAPTLSQVVWKVDGEGGEAEVQSDASLSGLWVLIEGSCGGSATERPGKRSLTAVNMPKNPHVKIQRFSAVVTVVCHYYF